MNQILKGSFYAFLFLSTLACAHRKSREIVISELGDKFPQIKRYAGDFHLVRGVTIEKPTAWIELYSQHDSLENSQEIILITNSVYKSYGIPLLSNEFSDYWNFPSDRAVSCKSYTNTTFENELNNCLDSLNLNDTAGSAEKIIDELLFSILHCQRLQMSDSSKLLRVNLENHRSCTDEDYDSCSVRITNNWNIIANELTFEARYSKSVFWDEANSRVYIFDYSNFKKRRINKFKLRSLRGDCFSKIPLI